MTDFEKLTIAFVQAVDEYLKLRTGKTWEKYRYTRSRLLKEIDRLLNQPNADAGTQQYIIPDDD
jgi:hypothetical protein